MRDVKQPWRTLAYIHVAVALAPLALITIALVVSGVAAAQLDSSVCCLRNNETFRAPVTKGESARLLNGLKPADEIAPRLKTIKASIQALQIPFATKKSQMTSLSRGHAETIALDQVLVKLGTGFDAVEQLIRSAGGRASVDASRSAIDALRSRFEAAMKDLESKDKLGNFEIQTLMSSYNRAQTTASTVKKKVDDTTNSITQKIG